MLEVRADQRPAGSRSSRASAPRSRCATAGSSPTARASATPPPRSAGRTSRSAAPTWSPSACDGVQPVGARRRHVGGHREQRAREQRRRGAGHLRPSLGRRIARGGREAPGTSPAWAATTPTSSPWAPTATDPCTRPHPSGGASAARTSSSALMLFVALGGTAMANDSVRALITGADVRNGSLTGRDVRNGSLTRSDLAPGALRAGPGGPSGPAGRTGPRRARPRGRDARARPRRPVAGRERRGAARRARGDHRRLGGEAVRDPARARARTSSVRRRWR